MSFGQSKTDTETIERKVVSNKWISYEDYCQLSSKDGCKRLGKGGYGGVYSAYDTVKKRDAAIKIINKAEFVKTYKQFQNQDNKDDEEVLEIITCRVKDEVNTLINLSIINQCEYIVKYYDNFEDEENWYIVMENISGVTLDYYILQNRNSLKKRVVWTLMLQLILGLQHIHDNGYSHNDLGNDNIMLTGDFKIKYIDFGISCVEYCKKMFQTSFSIYPEKTLKSI